MTLLVFAPLRAEAAALGSRPGRLVLRSGMGPAKARIAAARGLAVEADAVAVAGVCAAVAPGLRAGDVVCASELRSEDGETIAVPEAERLAARIRGLAVHVGPVASVARLTGPARDAVRMLDRVTVRGKREDLRCSFEAALPEAKMLVDDVAR